MKRKITEQHVERHLVKRVKAVGGEVRKVRWVGRNGAPDRVAFLPDGTTWWVELKAPGKKPTPAQLREHTRLRRMKQIVVVIDSIEALESWVVS